MMYLSSGVVHYLELIRTDADQFGLLLVGEIVAGNPQYLFHKFFLLFFFDFL